MGTRIPPKRMRLKRCVYNLLVLAVYVLTLGACYTTKDACMSREPLTEFPESPHWRAQECTKNEIGDSLACLDYLINASTRFDHPNKHLLAWGSNDGHANAQINRRNLG